MANLTSEDVRKLIEASSWKHPYTGHGNDFVLPLVNDLGVRWTAFVRLIDAEGDKVQRLVILSSTDSVPEELRQRAYEFCNKWMAECSYVQTWFSEEQGKVYVSASVESPGDLPKKWLVDSFVGQSLEIIVKFWTESFVALGGLDRFKASQKAKAEATPESGAEPPENVREAAEQGDAESQFKMGEMYRKGVGVELDYAKAAMWFRKAAEQGHATAQRKLGVFYYKGNGIEKDFVESEKWTRKAAEQGEAKAQALLGGMYQDGTGVAQDYVEAAKWYRKAAEQGNAKAQRRLSELYGKGLGVKEDADEALKWLCLAAKQGDAEAQYGVGCVCVGSAMKGKVGAEGMVEGLKWFRKAAEQGHADAIFHCKLLDGIFGPQAERPAGNMSAKEEPCGHGNGDGPEGHSPVGKKKIGVGLGLLVVALVLLVGMFVLWHLCF